MLNIKRGNVFIDTYDMIVGHPQFVMYEKPTEKFHSLFFKVRNGMYLQVYQDGKSDSWEFDTYDDFTAITGGDDDIKFVEVIDFKLNADIEV